MGYHNIEKKSFGYSFLFTLTQFWHSKVFYKHVIVLNKENILKDANVIFTPNHQNALMDALALLFTIPRRLIFMARADIFAKTWVASILYLFKILPIYRSRDGKDAIQKNEAIFKRTAELLTYGNGLALFPEGSHEGVHKIRPLKKGFARIAFQTEEANSFSLNLKIIPIGIDYANYQDFRSSVLINYGQPIAVSDYYETYRKNPNQAINDLKDKLEKSMKKLIVDIESAEYYDLYNDLKDIFNEKMCQVMDLSAEKHLSKFKANREFIKRLTHLERKKDFSPAEMENLVRSYTGKRKSFGFSNEMISKGNQSLGRLLLKAILAVISFPLFLFGLFNNILPWGITIFAGDKIKDPQFKSSFKFVVSFVVFPVFYLIQFFILLCFCQVEWIPWVYLLILPLTAVFSRWWYFTFSRILKQWKIFILRKKGHPIFTQMLDEYNLIFEKLSQIIQ